MKGLTEEGYKEMEIRCENCSFPKLDLQKRTTLAGVGE